MPITYDIDVDRGMLIIEADGAVSQAERLDAMRAWRNDPRFRPGLQTLCNLSDTVSTPTLPELAEIVDVIKQHAHLIGRKKLAIVTSQPATFGVSRQFGAMAPASLLTVQVFRERDGALAWLKVPSA